MQSLTLVASSLGFKVDPTTLYVLAKVCGSWGFSQSGDDVTITFEPSELGKITSAVNNYQTLFLEHRKKATQSALSQKRWQATQFFMYDGVLTQADPAMGAITAAVVSSQFLPSDFTRKWKLADGEFRTWGLTEIITFGMSVSLYIQSCFDKESSLSDQVIAITSLDELENLDIYSGWPDEPEPVEEEPSE